MKIQPIWLLILEEIREKGRRKESGRKVNLQEFEEWDYNLSHSVK